MSARVSAWLAGPMPADVRASISALAATEGVVHVAVMPDVHLADSVCIGVVTASRSLLLPAAVGGDIGCGMSAVAFDADASLLQDRKGAATLLSALYERVPFLKHPTRQAAALPDALEKHRLSTEALERMKHREGRTQQGTLGRGNHFLELQRDDTSRLWLMVHTGSRGMGPAIRDRAVALAGVARDRQVVIEAGSELGAAYLSDHDWARRYAMHGRALIVERVAEIMRQRFCVEVDRSTYVDCDHNRVRRERIGDEELWVHRKGALHAGGDVPGVIPGSMGTRSFHVVGRGCLDALCSSSHGAGRAMSRTRARDQVSERELLRRMEHVWFDHRLSNALRAESPAAYKDIGRVMRAQRDLTRVVRTLSPVLVYKAGE